METIRLPNGLEVFHLNRRETRFLYQDIIASGAYLRHGITLRAGDVVFDVGANIGLAMLFFWTAQPTIQLFAFEPQKHAFQALRANIEKHGCRAKAFAIGLAAEAGEREFTVYVNNSLMSGLHADVDQDMAVTRAFMANAGVEATKAQELLVHIRQFAHEVVRVQLERLSDIIRKEQVGRIDLLKVDVEKAELDVLAGIDDEHWPRIRQLVIEVHDLDGRLAHIVTMLTGRGYQVVSEQEPELRGTNLHNVYAIGR